MLLEGGGDPRGGAGAEAAMTVSQDWDVFILRFFFWEERIEYRLTIEIE